MLQCINEPAAVMIFTFLKRTQPQYANQLRSGRWRWGFLQWCILRNFCKKFKNERDKNCGIESAKLRPRAHAPYPSLIRACAPARLRISPIINTCLTHLNPHQQVPYVPLSCLVLSCYNWKLRYVSCVRSN